MACHTVSVNGMCEKQTTTNRRRRWINWREPSGPIWSMKAGVWTLNLYFFLSRVIIQLCCIHNCQQQAAAIQAKATLQSRGFSWIFVNGQLFPSNASGSVWAASLWTVVRPRGHLFQCQIPRVSSSSWRKVVIQSWYWPELWYGNHLYRLRLQSRDHRDVGVFQSKCLSGLNRVDQHASASDSLRRRMHKMLLEYCWWSYAIYFRRSTTICVMIYAEYTHDCKNAHTDCRSLSLVECLDVCL